MQNTEYLGLNKPESTDFYNVNDFNENFDTIDGKFKNLSNVDNTADKNKRVQYAENAGKAASADKLSNAVKINGVDFDGSKDVTISDSERSIITNTATGENITVTNSTDAPVRSLKVDGKTEQFTTTGKNLVNVPKNCTFTHTKSITALPQVGTYTLSCGSIVKGGDNNPILEVRNSAGATINYIELTDNTNTKLAIAEGATVIVLYSNGWYQESNGITTTINELMLSVDGGEYEPYTNGASPNPDYPQDIKGVGDSGEVEVTVTGKNIFGGDVLADKLVEVASAVKDESTGTVTYSADRVNNDVLFENFKENTQYTFILNGYNSKNDQLTNMVIKYTDGTTSPINIFINNQSITSSIVGKTVQSLSGVWSDGNTSLYYDKCGIFEGVVSVDDFEEYKSQTVKIPVSSPLYAGDYVRIKNGKLEVYRENAKVVFDGSEEWSLFTYTGINQFSIVKDDVKTSHIQSTHFRYIDYADRANNYETISVATSDHTRIFFNTQVATTIEEWKSYLAENPITVVYKLAEPTTETIETDIDISTYCNVTHFTNADNANMEVEYFTNSANGEVVGELQEQVNEKVSVSYLKDYIVVEQFFKDIVVPSDFMGAYVIEIGEKDGYTPIFCKVETHDVWANCQGSEIDVTSAIISATIVNRSSEDAECTIVATVIYVKNI